VNRLIGHNPCEGVRLSRRRRKDTDDQVITQHELITQLLPAVPDRYRALVGLAGGTGLRWGECAGLRWDAVDLATRTVRVVRVAVEVSGHVTDKPYPKSRAGRRVVPLPGRGYFRTSSVAGGRSGTVLVSLVAVFRSCTAEIARRSGLVVHRRHGPGAGPGFAPDEEVRLRGAPAPD
jgi:integrase